MLHTATTRSCEGWKIIHSNLRRVATWASSPTGNDISTLQYNYCTCTHVRSYDCTHHSHQRYPKHNMNAALVSSARSPARSVALNYIASPQESVHSKPHLRLSWGAQEVALALSMPWWQIQHEQGHPQHLKKKVTITTCCMLSVYCAIVTFSPLISGGGSHKRYGYPSACFLGQLGESVNFSHLQFSSN